MAQARFSHSPEALKTLASDALAHAIEKGSSACETESPDGYGQTVPVRNANSEAASVPGQQWHFALANSHGFLEGFPTSRHTISCAVIAAEDGRMQRDDWYVSQRSSQDLARPEAVGDYAGRRALARLRSRKIGTGQAPVLFDAPVANDMLATFDSAVTGGSLYRNASVLFANLG